MSGWKASDTHTDSLTTEVLEEDLDDH